MRALITHSFNKVRWSHKIQLLVVFISFVLQPAAFARIEAVLHTDEGMKEHTSPEPRRLMHDVLLAELNKGSVVRILNLENSPQPVKYRRAPYHVAANLIAFRASPQIPVRVSLSIQLINYSSGAVVLTSDNALSLDQSLIESALKLHNQDFDNSVYGKTLVLLTRASAKTFEQKVAQMKVE